MKYNKEKPTKFSSLTLKELEDRGLLQPLRDEIQMEVNKYNITPFSAEVYKKTSSEKNDLKKAKSVHKMSLLGRSTMNIDNGELLKIITSKGNIFMRNVSKINKLNLEVI